MSLHDRLAEKARLMGKTSADFYTAANKKANAAWIIGFAGAALLYFVGWHWAAAAFILAGYLVIQSISASITAGKLETLERS